MILNEAIALTRIPLCLHVLMTDRGVSEALDDGFEACGGVVDNSLGFLTQFLGLFLGSHNACPVQIHQNARLVVADEAQTLADCLSRRHSRRDV